MPQSIDLWDGLFEQSTQPSTSDQTDRLTSYKGIEAACQRPACYLVCEEGEIDVSGSDPTGMQAQTIPQYTTVKV